MMEGNKRDFNVQSDRNQAHLREPARRISAC
jgi:hypothetical protein